MERESDDYFSGSSYVKELSSADFQPYAVWKLNTIDSSQNSAKASGGSATEDSSSMSCSLILFYAPWCPHCKDVKDSWERLGKMAPFIDVFAFNAEKNKAHMNKIREDLPGLVQSFPTILLYKGNEPVEHYEGERTVGGLLRFAMEGCSS
jgi:thiol-disulfide isomerase/thioredoxin